MKYTFGFKEINYGIVEIESDVVPDRTTVIQAIHDGDAIWGDSEYENIECYDENIVVHNSTGDFAPRESVQGYKVLRAVVFENDRGFAIAENSNAPDPFVTWQFTQDDKGNRDYYWGRYTSNLDSATQNYENRIWSYQEDYNVFPKDVYKYFSTQRPIDIATYPTTATNTPINLKNFESREEIEHGRRAWGYLVYDAPLTDKQIDDYELRASSDNPDVMSVMRSQAETVGHWEELKGLPVEERFTWHRPSIQGFDLRDPTPCPEQMAKRFDRAKREFAHIDNQISRKPIREQLAEAARMIENNDSNVTDKKNNRDER